MKKKIIAIALCAALAVGGVVAGSLAWLTDSEAVENTFTVGNVDIDLTETNHDDNGQNTSDPNKNSYKMIPGIEIDKDPKVTVVKDSEACYLFVKVEETNPTNTNKTLKDYLSYTVNTGDVGEKDDVVTGGWTALDTEKYPGVYYRVVNAETAKAGEDYYVLTDNKVTVNTSVTKADMDALEEDGATLPKLTFTAYAIQKEGFADAKLAWAKVNP